MPNSSNSPLHVVLGAGPAGVTLVEELVSRGLRVRQVSRSPITGAPDGVETRVADLSVAEQAIAATEGATAIYHAVNVAYHLAVAAMPGIASAILAAAERSGARLVVLDTIYPYGEADGEAITERTPWAATSRKGRMRAELDAAYLEAHEAGRVRVALGRAADFYGPRVLNSTLGQAFFPAVLTGETAFGFGDISLPHSYSFLPDVAAGLVDLGTTGDASALGRAWHLPAVPAVSTAEVHELAGEIVGHPVAVEVLSRPEPAGPFDETFMREYAEMFYQHTIPQNMVSAAFEKEFGRRPTPLAEGLRQTLDWYRDRLASRS
ncbi:NAD-dependent epimerase/dehydratase family protein [Saccharopolyspora gloriosae]|uniref:NAD-dependent epimerase/dehydratase family protein n=1 Tax=Saccharopolyspora gloriosae TaxID=455344 RepID=UPI001FB78427|nr:NAD-dependent epimerase/dehydratase family protein [Saccharopolyspora gloriosae]